MPKVGLNLQKFLPFVTLGRWFLRISAQITFPNVECRPCKQFLTNLIFGAWKVKNSVPPLFLGFLLEKMNEVFG